MSNEPKHTPTPWHVDKFAEWCIEDKDRVPIADCGDYADEYPNGIANAARIVQCVNACEGLDDPEKWIKQQKEYRTEMANSSLSVEVDKRIVLQSQLESLRAANAELVEALREAKDELIFFYKKTGTTPRIELDSKINSTLAKHDRP